MIRRPGVRRAATPGRAASWLFVALFSGCPFLSARAPAALPPQIAATPAQSATAAPRIIPASDADRVIELIKQCVARSVPDIDMGYTRFAQRCPELIQALQHSDVAHWLPRDWTRPTNDLTVAGLRQLGDLLRAELDRPRPRAAPSLAKLDAALERFAPAPASSGWWARFRAWLRHALETPDPPASTAGLPRWLRVPPLLLARLIVGAAVLIVLLALASLARQLQAVRATARQSPRAGTSARSAQAPALTLAQIERAPLLEQPGLLLRLVAPRVSASGAALTARELRARVVAQARATPGASGFEPLIELAEAIRYAPRPPPAEEIRTALVAGRAALSSLRA